VTDYEMDSRPQNDRFCIPAGGCRILARRDIWQRHATQGIAEIDDPTCIAEDDAREPVTDIPRFGESVSPSTTCAGLEVGTEA
jgi:hypothetical protein